MRKLNCYNTFREGQTVRAGRPLPYGLFKLKDCQSGLEQCLDELGWIREFVSSRAGKWVLNCCTVGDMHSWLKNLPPLVANCLSYELLPGLLALVKDGATSADVNSAYPGIERSCLDLLDRLESVRMAISRCIGVEYGYMKKGGSLLEPLVREAIQITNRALDVLPPAKVARQSP